MKFRIVFDMTFGGEPSPEALETIKERLASFAMIYARDSGLRIEEYPLDEVAVGCLVVDSGPYVKSEDPSAASSLPAEDEGEVQDPLPPSEV